MSEKLHAIFVANVRELMDERGWSQADLAKKLGVTPGFVSQLLSGHRHPGLDSLENLAKAFRVDASELLKKLSLSGAKSA